ncbi:MAG: adenylyltransferase/cytidyltransferase family protein [Candidatus Levybacteria bacterium]|nr:adenylyltransferase/cytidyltransferase family protein [Candidatus Levybacteria bacterium]
MNKILNPKQAIDIAKRLNKQNNTIILAGGCFDVLHFGHEEFLKNAKKQADFLFVFLESDESVKIKKGKGRPINSQNLRAKNLAKFSFVDFVILLPLMTKNEEYDRLVTQIEPDIIATTEKDPNSVHSIRQARLIKGKVRNVIKRIPGLSTTNLVNGEKL